MSHLESPESAGMSSARLERIRPVMQRYVDTAGYGGFVARVVRRGKLVHADTIGFQDRAAGIPMADDTIFRIYSMTKPVIATALMTLYEEGAFQLVDPVAKFLPAFGATKVMEPDGSLSDQNPLRPMQVRDLMTHTSGLTYDFLDDFPVGEQYRAAKLMHDPTRSLEQVVAELATIPLAFHPGAQWHYSLGLDVAAHLIEVLTGKPCGDVLQERLFGPLGMIDTGFGVPEAQRHRLAAMEGHPDLFGEGATFMGLFPDFLAGNRGPRDVSGTYPADAPDVFQRGGIGLFSTAADFAAFGQMLLDGKAPDGRRILSRKTLELMLTNHLPAHCLPYAFAGVPLSGWGFGLGTRVGMDVGQLGVAGTVGEHGWLGAAKTYYWVDPAEELVGILLSQFMVGFDLPENDFRALVLQAIDD